MENIRADPGCLAPCKNEWEIGVGRGANLLWSRADLCHRLSTQRILAGLRTAG